MRRRDTTLQRHGIVRRRPGKVVGKWWRGDGVRFHVFVKVLLGVTVVVKVVAKVLLGHAMVF